MNQCDGCSNGLAIKNGYHRIILNGKDMPFGLCTKKKENTPNIRDYAANHINSIFPEGKR